MITNTQLAIIRELAVAVLADGPDKQSASALRLAQDTLDLAGIVELRAKQIDFVRALMPDVCQLLDGWRQTSKPGEWTEWDQSVRERLAVLNKALESNA